MPSYWTREEVPPRPAIRGEIRADVCVVGAGFTGLWTALELLERRPELRVTVCDARTVGYGASGRNGGFLEASLTHGLANGVRHFPDEIAELERLSAENYDRMQKAFVSYDIDCDFRPTGTIELATRPHELADLADSAELETRFGHEVELLDRHAVREHLHSPALLGGLRRPRSGGLVDPGRLVRGLARSAEGLGAHLYEHSPVVGVERDGSQLRVRTPEGTVRCDRVILATNAYSGGVLRRTRRHFVPVHDYVLMTRPLTPGELASIGWSGREGMSDAGNQFHYFRLTADDRILWGGYDAVYYRGNGIGARYDDRPATYRRLEEHFRALLPTLAEVEFTHRWGGPIATTSRFTPVFGRAFGGRLSYALGYTGLGVAATCFAARILADTVTDPASPLLRLDYVRRAPFPFPPEPARSAVIGLTRNSLARADRTGRRGLWLRVLDRAGIGFDS